MAMTLDQMVDAFVKLRDKVTVLKKEQTDALAPYNVAMAKLEGMMLDTLNQNGAESMRTDKGTVYKTSRTSTKVTEWSATLDFIRSKECWELLEARVSKTAAEAIIQETQQPIPGVTTSREIAIGVRRS